VFREDDHYLSLPLNYHVVTNKSRKQSLPQIHPISGSQRSL
jgi:hypothetical protein